MALKVSIIIPAYNAEETIHDTLAAVLSQTHPDWEAIVVNDGSTDRTAEIVKEFLQKDDRIRLVEQRQGGEASARNAGLEKARQDWLLFLDADDWILPSYLERMTRELALHPELDAVHCGSARVAADGTVTIEKYLPPEGDLFPTLARRAAFPVHACVVRKSLVDAVGRFDTSLIKSPDWDLWQRIARTGARFGAVREVLAFYRMRPNAASLDAYQLFKDDLRVLRRGHSADDRVSNPHPDYANGMSPRDIQQQEFYLLCWCAGLLIGAGKDALPLLQLMNNQDRVELYPDAVAQCIFDSTPLPSCLPPEQWVRLPEKMMKRVEEFLAALEKQTRVEGLAVETTSLLKKNILKHSPMWNSTIAKLEQEQRDLRLAAEKNEKELQTTADEREKWRIHWQQIAEGLEKEQAKWEEIADEREKWRTHWQQVAETREKEGLEWQKIADEREKWRSHWEQIAESRGEMNKQLEKELNEWQNRAKERQSALIDFRKQFWIRIGERLGLLKPPKFPESQKAAETPFKLRNDGNL